MSEFREIRPGPRALWSRQTPAMRGIVMMLLSTLFASSMHMVVRMMARDLPPLQVAFFRNLFGLLVLMPLLLQAGISVLRTGNFTLHAVRGILNTGAMFMFFTGLSMTPLARASALNFTAPIFMALMSVIILGERFRFYRWLAIVMGFVGMLIILRPGLVVIDTGSLLVTGSAFLWAMAMVIIKIQSRTESSLTIVAWMSILMCVLSIGPALWVWQPLTMTQLGWLFVLGCLGTGAQMSISQAFKEADPTTIMPLDFIKLIWATLYGIWLFGEVPDIYTWVGAFVIFSSGLMIAYREKRNAARAARTSPPASIDLR